MMQTNYDIVNAMREVKKELFWLKLTISMVGGGIIGVLMVIAEKIH